MYLILSRNNSMWNFHRLIWPDSDIIDSVLPYMRFGFYSWQHMNNIEDRPRENKAKYSSVASGLFG